MEDIFSEKLCYNFDFPALTETGYLEINEKKIVLFFPEKSNISVKDSIKLNQKFQFYIDNVLVFCSEWLPIHSLNDYWRFKDMIEKCLHSYAYLSGNNVHSLHTYACKDYDFYNSLITDVKKDNYSLYCLEDHYNTSVQLTKANKETDMKHSSFQLQLYIGNNLVLCTDRDFKCLSTNDIYFIVQFVLSKLLK
jgi:hypothetical protein